MDNANVKRRLTCILAADAVGYSKQMGQDEEGTIRVLAAHRSVIDGIIAFHHGRIVSTAGDSVLAEFGSAVEAVRSAVEIQDALKTRNDALPTQSKMLFRVGVNLGDVVVKNEDLLGDGVNVAARLETMAEPGGICIASSVYDQITGKLDLGFQDIGEQNLKNISRPVRVYRVSGSQPALRLATQTEDTTPTPTRTDTVRPLWMLIVGALVLLTIGAAFSWWLLRPSPPPAPQSTQTHKTTTESSAEAGQPTPGPSAPSAAAADSEILSRTLLEAQRLRDEAAILKQQAASELVSTRIQTAKSPAKPVTATANNTKAASTATASSPRLKPPTEETPGIRPEGTKTPPPLTEKAGESATTGPPAAVPSVPSIQHDSSAVGFDGLWQVQIQCGSQRDGAQSYQMSLVAEVRDGYLRGESGEPGQPGWLLLTGPIRPDGRAQLNARGLTADPKFSVGKVQPGTPYNYPIMAEFEGSRGTGSRRKLRPCNIDFKRQH